MVFKKIIHDSFEQIIETGKDVAKSSAKQVKETFNPWDMIRNSFSEVKDQQMDQVKKAKEGINQGDKHTPLNFNKLQESYKNQDEQKMIAMKQRLFQIVKNDEEKTLMKGKQEKAEKERTTAQEEADNRRREEEQKRQQSVSSAPEGKSGRGTALMGKKRRKPTEPQPAETKPGGGKQ